MRGVVGAGLGSSDTNCSEERRCVRMTRGVLGVSIALLLWPQGGWAGQDLSLEEVLERATAHVMVLGNDLSTVVMDERTEQTYDSGREDGVEQRELRSEFLLVRVQDLYSWKGFRDVFEVDGVEVHDGRDRIQEIFLAGAEALPRLQTIVEESARHNLGPTTRTLNEPTYALFFLHDTHRRRFRWAKSNEACQTDPTAWAIAYEEVQYPTLTRGLEGASLPASGRFCIDPTSGAVLGSELSVRHESPAGNPLVEADVAVSFTYDEGVGTWVPSQMRETYLEAGGHRTVSVATYSNYRRFGTKARLLPQ